MNDLISRQAAISAICNACGKIDCDKMDKCEKLQLPPANCSEIPNNCEHITEDGVTCAKYPACDDCLDNPLNKVKGSERLVKGSEQTEPTISKMEQVDEPQTYVINPQEPTNDDKCFECDDFFTCGGQCNKIEDEPQTERSRQDDNTQRTAAIK